MTTLLLLAVAACVVWLAVRLAPRGRNKDPVSSVETFTRALDALAPDPHASPRMSRRQEPLPPAND